MALKTRRSRRRVRIFSIASVAIVALVAGVVWLGLESPETGSDEVVPELTLSFFDGTSQQLSDLRGRPVVLNFWASWCPACVSEMPAFGEVHRRLGDQVEFIGVNMQEVSLDAAKNLAVRTDVDYRLAHDPDGAIYSLFGGIAMPTTVFISEEGVVEQVHAGTIFEEDLTAIIESKLLGWRAPQQFEEDAPPGKLHTTFLVGSGDSTSMKTAQDQHMAWLARSFGRPDYLPLTDQDIEALKSVAEPISRFTGSHLFKEGESAVAAFVIRSGEVDLYRMHNGRRRVVARIGPGSVIGDIAMFGEGTYMSSARAVNQVQAFRLERETLIPELAQHPALCLRWLVAALRQLQNTQRRIVHLMHKTVLAQVADLLVEESAKSGPDLELSQGTIATLLGSSRQTVNEAIGTLRDMGAVKTGYRMISVVDPQKVIEVAAGHVD